MKSNKLIPIRMCVATFERRPKGELLRIFRTNTGKISIDLTGERAGRGAYLTMSLAALQLAKKKKSLQRHLKTPIDEQFFVDLSAVISEKEQC